MADIGQLATAYHLANDQCEELDRQGTVIPLTDITGRDALLVDMDDLLEQRNDIVRKLIMVKATTLADIQTKAGILLIIANTPDDLIIALARSIAEDVVLLSHQTVIA